MKLHASFLVLILFSALHTSAQEQAVFWFPDHVAFRPFLASPEEARLGLMQHLGESPLLLQIGGSPDVAAIPLGNDTLRWGPDFIVLGLSREFKGVLFKIAAADGIFGMHFTWRLDERWNLRFRAMHRSAHLVDGSFDGDRRDWDNGREPFNYTRNYGEIHASFEPSPSAGGAAFRFYAGVSGSVWTRPRSIRALGGLLGAELRSSPESGWYAAYHLTVAAIPHIAGTNSVEGGIRFGSWRGRGVRVFLSVLNGPDVMGAFYDLRTTYAGLGAAFDIW
jgi:hypothetical protein